MPQAIPLPPEPRSVRWPPTTLPRPEAADSLEIVLREVEPLLEGSSMEGLPAYYRMVDVARRIQVAGTEEAVRLSQNYVDSIRSCPPRTIYEEASQLFLKGIAAYKLGSAEGKMHMERGLPYWVDEMALLPKMKPTARRNFHAQLITCLISVYGSKGDRDALVRTADDYLAMLDSYYLDPEVAQRRPYIPKEMSYLTCYYAMCTSPLIERGRRRSITTVTAVSWRIRGRRTTCCSTNTGST